MQVVDSAGVQLVRNLYAGFDTAAIQPIEDLRIGQVDGPEAYQFFRINGIAVDDLGRILVANGGSALVREYDAQGHWLRDIGSKGNGPGEFTLVNAVAIWKDTLGVSDGQRLRFALFDTAGHFLSQFPLALPDNRVAYPLGGSEEGWSVWFVPFGGPRKPPTPGTVTRDTTRVGRVDMHVLATAYTDPARLDAALRGRLSWENGPIKYAQTAEGVGGYPELFAQGVWWGLDGSGRFWLNPGYPYRIYVHDLDGRLTRVISRAFREVAVTEAHVDEYVRRVAAAPRSRPGAYDPLVTAKRYQANAPRAPFFPPTRRIDISGDGELWVQRLDVHFDIANYETIPGTPQTPFYYDVFDRDGRYRATLRMPPGVSPRWISHDAFVGILRDENDVEFVVRYRLQQAGG